MAIFAIIIGIYPIMYLLVDMSERFLATKSEELLGSVLWNIAFYQHILFGGITLLVGWSQFLERFRNKYLKLHRNIGKGYFIAVLLSGTAGLYLSFFATTGWYASLGFGMLAVFWLYTTWRAYHAIRAKQIEDHKHWMIRSYALTFAAVTLRLWMPIFLGLLRIDFLIAYPIISWICWVPNLLFTELIIRRSKMRIKLSSV